jgi:serine/threonine-protein kinase
VAIEVGDVIRGRFLLTALIGRGGMGEVFAAKDQVERRDVAIKVVRRTAMGELFMARLEREALAARKIQSPFIPRVFEVDRTEDGEVFLVMQLLHGETLADRLRNRGGILSWEELRPIIDDVMSALLDAHRAEVVHRDLKPGNIFLVRFEAPTIPAGMVVPDAPAISERAMILDFGVCKMDVADTERLTTTGEAVGTIAYMAPEQIRGASKVDGRADLYAVAMVAFEALTGELAHDGFAQMQIVASKLERSARRLKDLARVPVPEGLDALIVRALSRKPDARYSTAQDMLRAWRQLGPATVLPRAHPISGPSSANKETETGLSAGAQVLRHPSVSRLGLVLATAGLVIASIVLVSALRHKPQATGEPKVIATVPTTVVTAPATALSVDPDPESDPGVVELENGSADAGIARPKPVRTVRRPPPPTTTKPATTLPPISTKPRY